MERYFVRGAVQKGMTADPAACEAINAMEKAGMSFGDAVRKLIADRGNAPLEQPEEPRPQGSGDDDAAFNAILHRWAVATIRGVGMKFHASILDADHLSLEELLDLVEKFAEPNDFAEWYQRRFPQ